MLTKLRSPITLFLLLTLSDDARCQTEERNKSAARISLSIFAFHTWLSIQTVSLSEGGGCIPSTYSYIPTLHNPLSKLREPATSSRNLFLISEMNTVTAIPPFAGDCQCNPVSAAIAVPWAAARPSRHDARKLLLFSSVVWPITDCAEKEDKFGLPSTVSSESKMWPKFAFTNCNFGGPHLIWGSCFS